MNIPTLDETVARFNTMPESEQRAVAAHYAEMYEWLSDHYGKKHVRREVVAVTQLVDEQVHDFDLTRHASGAWAITMRIKELGRVHWKANKDWHPPAKGGRYYLSVTGEISQSKGTATKRLRCGQVRMVEKEAPISPLFEEPGGGFVHNPFPKPGPNESQGGRH